MVIYSAFITFLFTKQQDIVHLHYGLGNHSKTNTKAHPKG